jgi:hypothetical protein
MKSSNRRVAQLTSAAIAVMLGGFVSLAALEPPKCSKEDAIAAETISASISSWRQLYSAFRRYSHCDDGAIGEGFSDAVSVLLSREWKTLDEGAALAKTDRVFKGFLLRHLNVTVPEERLAAIKQLAQSQCTKRSKSLCAEIIRRIDNSKK